MLPKSGESDEPLWLAESALLGLRYSGLQLLPTAGHSPHSITPVELFLLEKLASGGGLGRGELVARTAEESGAAREVISEAMDLFDERGLLRSQPVERMHRTEELPWAPEDPPVALQPHEILLLRTPLVLSTTPLGFVTLDHQGRKVLLLSARELLAVSSLQTPLLLEQALRTDEVVASGLTSDEFDAVVRRLLSSRVLHVASATQRPHEEMSGRRMRHAIKRKKWFTKAVDDELARIDADEEARRARVGVRRTRVVPVHAQLVGPPPLGLGMILAYLQAQEGLITERYLVWPDWISHTREVADLAPEPAVFLFSNYIWSHHANLEISVAVKEASPRSLIVHGGPDTPKYEDDTRAYLEANPHIDIAVHGEGEQTVTDLLTALAATVGSADGPDLSQLAGVPGITYRLGSELIRTAPRERLADLNVIPSPYLTGLFDAYGKLPNGQVIIETNRGCPYGCTFCDWGTSTMARIRKFDLDRVMGELEWIAENEVRSIAFADANFGIFERDVDIAARVLELRERSGYPVACGASYAKNTVKHLEKIISMWIDGGMVTRGILSLQSMDPSTLDAVHRSNIKTEKYDALAREFRRKGLPLYVDLMMGLPGMTFDSFLDDLQSCIDREVRAKIHLTELLPNSPMNAPEYRAEHGIQIRRAGMPGSAERDAVVTQTSTMSEDDFARMQRLRPVFLIGENFGVLRHLSRYLYHETGVREIELYRRIVELVESDPDRWPALVHMVATMARFLAPPVSWRLLYEEIRSILIDDFDVTADPALATVLDVQAAVVPSVGRPPIITLQLAHDYVSWHEQVVEAKFEGPDWRCRVPQLRDLPPGIVEVSDGHDLSHTVLGVPLVSAWFDSWELDSPLSRYFREQPATDAPPPVPA